MSPCRRPAFPGSFPYGLNKLWQSFFLRSAAFALVIAAVAGFALAQSAPAKKNSRPKGEETNTAPKLTTFVPVYSYTFSNPKFFVTDVKIEHDENGVGSVTFTKRDFEEEVKEPLQLSEVSLERIKGLWEESGFLAASEDYQSTERDYAHLGTITLKMSLDGKERSAGFNWTENKTVKEIADEYRKIGNAVIWMFDMNVARQNQPLETPRIMKGLDTYLRLNAISDPKGLLPFLRGLKDDERIPLIARNHADRLIKKIEASAN